MGNAQNLETLVESAYKLKDRVPNFKLLLVGHGTKLESLKAKAKSLNLNNVIFIPLVPPEKLAGILNLADVLFIHLKNDPLFEITVPSKTQLYLATGKPIIAGLKGDAAEIIKESGGGIVCEPGNSDDIAIAIERLLELGESERRSMAEKGSKFYKDKLSTSSGVDKFEAAFKDMLK